MQTYTTLTEGDSAQVRDALAHLGDIDAAFITFQEDRCGELASIEFRDPRGKWVTGLNLRSMTNTPSRREPAAWDILDSLWRFAPLNSDERFEIL